MTNRTKQIYDFIIDYAIENGYLPTVREIGDACSLSSTSTVQGHLEKLEDEKLITRPTPRSNRYKVEGLKYVKDNNGN